MYSWPSLVILKNRLSANLSEPACLKMQAQPSEIASVDSNASANSEKILMETRIKYTKAWQTF